MCNGKKLMFSWYSDGDFFAASFDNVINGFQVRANPSGALNALVFMCKAIASWHVNIHHQTLSNFFMWNMRQFLHLILCSIPRK